MPKPFPSEFFVSGFCVLLMIVLQADPDVRVSSVAREIAPCLGIFPCYPGAVVASG